MAAFLPPLAEKAVEKAYSEERRGGWTQTKARRPATQLGKWEEEGGGKEKKKGEEGKKLLMLNSN